MVIILFLLSCPSAPSAPPVNLSISDLESRSFHAHWAPPPITATNGIIRKYLVNLTDLSSGLERSMESFVPSLEIHSVHPYTVYLLSVSAFTVSGGPYAVLEVPTPQDGKFNVRLPNPVMAPRGGGS